MRNAPEQPHVPAGCIRRLLAMGYDAMLVAAVLVIGSFVFLPLTGGEAVSGAMRLVFQAYLLLLVVGFFAYFWIRGGQTLGLRAWKLRLQRKDGREITLKDVLIRLMAGLISLGPMGLVIIPFHPRGRSVADVISTTVVVRHLTREVA